MTLQHHYQRHSHQSGLTLIELMISVTLGLMLISAVMGILLSSNQNFAQDDQLARMQENGRFIMHRLDEEATMAGYWGGATYVGAVDKTGVVFPTKCGVSLDPAIPATSIIVDTNPATFGGCILNHKAGTPIYVVKRARGTPETTQVAGEPYIIGNNYDARLRYYNSGDAITAPAAGEEARKYQVNMYYIRDRNAENKLIPTLYIRRLEIVGGAPELVEYEAAEGIENIEIDFGIDINKDGVADYFNSRPAAAELQTAVGARIYILARATQEDINHKDEKIYTLGNTQVNGNADKFRRRLFTKSVVMRNTAYMLQLN
ncbi:MAG: PilW family protein [Proteobacteria bacterium]|nr:PilW family protein [Pseudomonadota bacterium]